MVRRVALVLGALVLLGGCGGHDVSVVQPTSPVFTAAPTTSTSGSPTATPTPRQGLPKTYPLAEVPLVAGQVQDGQPSSKDGVDKGWQVFVNRHGSAKDCFAAARASLLARGFTQQAIVTNDGVTQAQFTSSKYAVLLSSEDLPGKKCSVQYTVGAFGG